MKLKPKEFRALLFGLVVVALFGAWLWLRLPNWRVIVTLMEVVNCGACAAMYILMRASNNQPLADSRPPTG